MKITIKELRASCAVVVIDGQDGVTEVFPVEGETPEEAAVRWAMAAYSVKVEAAVIDPSPADRFTQAIAAIIAAPDFAAAKNALAQMVQESAISSLKG